MNIARRGVENHQLAIEVSTLQSCLKVIYEESYTVICDSHDWF
jgi:hypothetical protein